MGLIDSFWGTDEERNNPRKKHGKHRASRGTTSIPPKQLSKPLPPTPAEERWVTRTSYEAPHGERGFTPVKATGGRLSALEWAQKHKYKAVAGAATGAALLAYMMKPAQASVVTTPAVVQVTPAVDQGTLGKALGIGAFVAVAAGVALYASEN